MNNISSIKKHLPKTITYRVITSILGFLVIWLISNNLFISVLFTLSEIIYKPIIFIFNEIIWEKLKKTSSTIIEEPKKESEVISETTIKRLVYTKKID